MADFMQVLRDDIQAYELTANGGMRRIQALREALAEIERLREQVRVEKEENRWAYINAALEDKEGSDG